MSSTVSHQIWNSTDLLFDALVVPMLALHNNLQDNVVGQLHRIHYQKDNCIGACKGATERQLRAATEQHHVPIA